MTTSFYIAPADRASAYVPRTASVLSTAILRMVASWERRCERFRQRQAMAALDERILNDIGLTRGDIEHELHRPSWKV